MRKTAPIAAAVAAMLMLASCGGGGGETKPTAAPSGSAGGATSSDLRLVNVVKLVGVGWFDRMEVGVKEYAKETGIDATQTGADDASPEKQVAVVQDLIAQKPKAITVVPNSPEALESVFKRAMDEGIIIVTHEASNQKNMHADIEAFANADYGAAIMDGLAGCMGNQGKYFTFVGHLTAQTHMEWAEGALQQAKTKYSKITRVLEPVESKEDEQVAYEKTKEILALYPDLTGIQGSAGTDVAGAARAVLELGLQDKVCVMGTSIPSVSKKYLNDGSIDKIFFWDPAMAGKAMLKIATLLAEGKQITAGTDLGIPGYTSLKVSPDNPKVFYGDAALSADKSNVDKYDF